MNEISKREFFLSVLNAVGGRLQKSITYGDHFSDTKDNNVLKSCKSKEKKIEYIQSQLDLFTRFLEAEDVTIGHYAVEVAKDNITLSQENTFIHQHILKMCRAFIIDFFYDEFDEYVKSLPPDTDFDDINVCINFLPELCKDESKKDLITRFTFSMEQGLRKRRFDIKLDSLTTKDDYDSKSEIYSKVVNNEVSKEDESDTEYRISLNGLLSKYQNYHSKGNDNQDYQYVKNLGYISPDGCSTKDNYCSGHMHGWIRFHLMRKIVLKNGPFNSYKEKIDFVLLHLDLFQSVFMLNIKLNDDGEDVFTTLPETDEDSLYFFEIGFKLRNDELTNLKSNGTKEILAIPLKSFKELKDEVHKRIENSRDPKVLIENELLKLDAMFINEKRTNPGYYFKLEYDRQVNVTEYTHNPKEWYMSSAIIEYIPIVKPYVEYYFFLKDIIDNEFKSLGDIISTIKTEPKSRESNLTYDFDKPKIEPNPFETFIYNININDVDDLGRNINIFSTNPFDYFYEVKGLYLDCKNFISSELRKISIVFDRHLYLDELTTILKRVKTTEAVDIPDSVKYLEPFGLSYLELMRSTDKKITIVYEIGLSQEKINYFYPRETNRKENDRIFEQKATFVRLVPFHFKTKMIEYITGLKEKLEKDTNLKLHSNSATSPSIVKETNNINYESYEFFKKWFEYPLEHSPLGYYHQWQENLKYLKTEIEDNLLNLDTTKSNIYLSKLTRELLDILKTSNTTVEELNIWYDKYNTSEEDLVKNYDYKNTLHKILNSEPINDRNAFDDDHHPDTDKLQWSFYDFHYGQIIKAALAHINKSILLLNPNTVNSSPILQSDDQLQPVSEFYSSNQSSPIKDSKINPLVKRFLFSLTSKNWKEKVSHFDSEINSNSFPDFSQDILQEFKDYLLNFNWDYNLPEVTEIQWKGITLINPENDGKSLYGYDPFYHDEPYNIFYRSVKEYNFYKQILVKPILLQDLDLVRKLLKAIIKKLNVKTAFIGSQGNDFINNINKKTNEFISSGLKERFNLNLLDYFDIDLIEYPDVQEIYRQFKKLWIERFAEIYSNNNSSEGKENDDIELDVQSHSDIEDNLARSPQNGIKSQTEGFKFKKTLTEIERKTILEDHHDELVRLGLIDRCMTNFKSAYIGNKPFTKIKWKKGIPLLQYYVKKFSALVDNRTKWVIPAQIFLKFDGSEISNEQLAKTQLSAGPIKKDNDIDDLIADFYSKLEK